MNEIWKVYLVFLLLAVLVSWQTVVATDEYEYYYEEVNATTTTSSVSSTPSTVTTAVVPIAMEAETVTEAATVSMDFETSEKPNITTISVGSSKDGATPHTNWVTTTAVEGENVNLSTHDVRRTDEIKTILNGTRPTKFTNTMYKTTSKPKSNNPPAIVLNIYTGMYGMDSRGNNRPSGNLAGRNNFWPRSQTPLQGWYGMYNRMPAQSFAPRQQQRPVYRGRGPQQNYDESFNGFTYQKATKPRRNSQQNRGNTLDQQASMAVFNFLLQALGQRTGSSPRSSQMQGQQGSRRKV